MQDEIASCLGKWWASEARSLAGASLVGALLQTGLVLLVMVIGQSVFAGMALILGMLLAALGGFGWFIHWGYVSFAVVTCGLYPFLRRPARGYLLASETLPQAIALPAGFVDADKDAFDPGPGFRLSRTVASIVFSLPVALEGAWAAWRDVTRLMRPHGEDAGLVLAALATRARSIPFSELAKSVRCDWPGVLPRLALLPGLQLLPGRGDAFALSDELREQLVTALEAEGVVFDVSD
ncbi:MAG: hypothetical protein IPP14_02865 [Planctomycetes bacterium]|nr:hypothetical protein [Planctomycetota bacterium]